MPLLTQAPWKPLPEVELISSVPITIEEATSRIDQFMKADGSQLLQKAASLGHKHIKIMQLPDILEQLQREWVGRSGTDRPSECFVEVRGRLEVHMHPRYIGEQLAFGLSRHACEILLRYSSTLGCIPLAYSDLRPTGSHGAVVAESPWVHFLVDFRAVGFAPKKDQWLLGTTNTVQGAENENGVGLKTLGYFTCWVESKDVPEALRFDNGVRGWVDEKGGRMSEESRAVWFRITKCSIKSEHSIDMKGAMKWPPAKHLHAAAASSKATSSSLGGKSSGSTAGAATANGSRGDDGDDKEPVAKAKKKRRRSGDGTVNAEAEQEDAPAEEKPSKEAVKKKAKAA